MQADLLQAFLFVCSLMLAPPPEEQAAAPVAIVDLAPADALGTASFDVRAARRELQVLRDVDAERLPWLADLPKPPREMLEEWQAEREPTVEQWTGSNRAQWQAFLDGLNQVHIVAHGGSATFVGGAFVLDGVRPADTIEILDRLVARWTAIFRENGDNALPLRRGELPLDGRAFATYATPYGLLVVNGVERATVVSLSLPLARALMRRLDPATRDAAAPTFATRLLEAGVAPEDVRPAASSYHAALNLPKALSLVAGIVDLGERFDRRHRENGPGMGVGAVIDLFFDLDAYGPAVTYYADGRYHTRMPLSARADVRRWFRADDYLHPALAGDPEQLMLASSIGVADAGMLFNDIVRRLDVALALSDTFREGFHASHHDLRTGLREMEEFFAEPPETTAGRLREVGFRLGVPAENNAPGLGGPMMLGANLIQQAAYVFTFADDDSIPFLWNRVGVFAAAQEVDKFPALPEPGDDGVRFVSVPLENGGPFQLTVNVAARGRVLAIGFSEAGVRQAVIPAEVTADERAAFVRGQMHTAKYLDTVVAGMMLPALMQARVAAHNAAVRAAEARGEEPPAIDPAAHDMDAMRRKFLPPELLAQWDIVRQTYVIDDAGFRADANFSLELVSAGAIGAGILIPAMQRAREAALRTSCMANLRQIGIGLQLYAAEHDNMLPPDLDALKEGIIPDGLVFQCPSTGGGYVMVEGAGGAKLPPQGNTMVVYEAEDHGGEGRNAAFGDGHVRFIRTHQFDRELEKAKEHFLGKPADAPRLQEAEIF